MPEDAKRNYVSPLRSAAAAATRLRIVSVAKPVFEERGWTGASLPAIAAEAEVSAKTIQAQFGTKAKLLTETVDFAVRGDVAGPSTARRATARAIKAAPDAREALTLHAAMATALNGRAAWLAAAVETGAASEPALVPLWKRMRENMQFGVRWAAETVLGKPGLRNDLSLDEVETVFQVAMAWGTYRTLASTRGMTGQEIEGWIGDLYERMLLPAGGSSAGVGRLSDQVGVPGALA